ncbi:hypothetical protein TRVA0_088S00232 [Trichomonascus vanleenenianus]|uniref:SDR family oxidoreductase n=1 Tax=Trichomonascus vanleenenianus TaxID=2268995 RepID=UPI003ECB175A
MRVFVTGASGFIGQAVTKDLLAHGHKVIGLARSDESADILSKLGVEVHRGDLTDVASLKDAAQIVDGIIHLAFIHDFEHFEKSINIDLKAIEAMAEGLAGTGKPLVIVGGTAVLPAGIVGTEETMEEKGTAISKRAESARALLSMAEKQNVRGCVVRLPTSVHGEGDKGFIPSMIFMARTNGLVTLVGNGSNRWPAVHRDDAAVLLRLVLEKGKPCATYHAVGEEGVALRDVAQVIGKRLELPVEEKTPEEATKLIGFLAQVIGKDNVCSSDKTKAELGWEPKGPTLVEDMEEHYFEYV